MKNSDFAVLKFFVSRAFQFKAFSGPFKVENLYLRTQSA